MRLRRLVVVAGIAALLTSASSPRTAPWGPCDGPGADPWVTALRDRVIAFDGLARYAVTRRGPPLRCEGSVTAEFDGGQFGFVRMGFGNGMTLHVETMPPETQIVTLRDSSGFADVAGARRALQTYAADFGVSIDWTAPIETRDDRERILTFRDPDPGLNSSAALVFAGTVLVALRFSAAL